MKCKLAKASALFLVLVSFIFSKFDILNLNSLQTWAPCYWTEKKILKNIVKHSFKISENIGTVGKPAQQIEMESDLEKLPVQDTFMKTLLHARSCSWHLGYVSEQNRQRSCLHGSVVQLFLSKGFRQKRKTDK